VTGACTAILHPWLREERSTILAALPAVTPPEEERPEAARWKTWLGHEPRAPLPPVRLILIWDNLTGHLSWSIVDWLFQHGVMPRYTPLSGSWLNLAEALQRILVRRALAGQHPQSPGEIITWLEDTVAAWNEDPTPFTWGGKRKERRDRARQRRLGGSPAVLTDPHSNAACPTSRLSPSPGRPDRLSVGFLFVVSPLPEVGAGCLSLAPSLKTRLT